jgi:hypothetical protein
VRLFLSRAPEAVRNVSVDERRLAWAVTSAGGPLVATPTHLYVDGGRLPWTRIERVVWKPPTLTLIEVAPVAGTGRTRSFVLETDHRLAEIVRSRVTSSVGWSDRRTLVPSGAVRLVGRRTPGVDTLEWQTVWEPGTDPSDPALRAQAEEWVAALRKTIG